MGYSLSLLALQTQEPSKALSQLGYVRTGQFCTYAEKPILSYALPSNWFLIVAKGCDNRFLKPKFLKPLSELYPVIACSIEEHTMFSSSEYWSSGNQIWRAEHMGENGPIDLQISGILPPEFEAMSAAHKRAQEAEVEEKYPVDHYFDIPLNAAKAIIGFKHDEEIFGIDYEKFEILFKQSHPKNHKAWWCFWK